MLRTFGIQTLTGLAQPLFGDTLTAPSMPPPVDSSNATLTVASTARYQVGDRIILDAGQPTQDVLKLAQIMSSTVMQAATEGTRLRPHAAGALVALSIACAEIVVQAVDGGVGNVWIGADNTITNAGLGSAVRKIIKVAAAAALSEYRMTNTVSHNAVRTTDAWMAGAAGDAVIVSAVVV